MFEMSATAVDEMLTEALLVFVTELVMTLIAVVLLLLLLLLTLISY